MKRNKSLFLRSIVLGGLAGAAASLFHKPTREKVSRNAREAAEATGDLARAVKEDPAGMRREVQAMTENVKRIAQEVNAETKQIAKTIREVREQSRETYRSVKETGGELKELGESLKDSAEEIKRTEAD
ncbi:MAG TPA: YtxH domain-containing protein [Bacillales bacterium]|nr:YtxH domain-containing protein [Bacillales bacterium]